MTSTNAQISEYAEPPLTPFKPKKLLLILLAGILSAVAASLMSLLYESMDNTVHGTEDVEGKLKTPMLGILPLVQKNLLLNSPKNAIVPGSIKDDKGAFAESIRTIRTGISLGELQALKQVIMVTSAVPSEGKSTLASNLAYSLSHLEDVLLIECDMRRPSLHKSFDLPKKFGLAQLLSGQERFIDCIKLNVAGDLDVIPAGDIPDKPLELLSSRRMKHLIDQMKKRYDRIILDCAPVQAVSDALLLGTYACLLYTSPSPRDS